MANTTNSRSLDGQQIARLVSGWDEKTVAEFAGEFDVSEATVRNCVYKIRKLYPGKCPKKQKKRLDDSIHEAMRILGQAEASGSTAMTHTLAK